MEQNRVVNIINFVRAVEPRCEMDLVTPVVEEIRLNKKYGFENTFLLQYDTMCSEKFVNLFLKEKDEHMELGVWIEMAKPLVESIGVEWKGRWEWDWHVNPGFLMAYTKEQKEKLIDAIMEKFKSLFGYYPKSAGSWLLDSDSVLYMSEKYQVQAFGICREQWGTDGYTLWGGYYNGPYYPSKNNILHPAQTKEMQISAPVIRILGPDPIYCYYEKFKTKYNKMETDLYTLEPTWSCGQDKEWVKWYFKNFTKQEDMGFSYTQTGQENPFGWENISKGLPMQMEYLARLVNEGEICVKKMCDTGKRFIEMYEQTPQSVYAALDDWAGMDNQSVWYSCKNYRINVFSDDQEVWIRDLHKFDENYRDIYLEKPCTEPEALYDCLPLVDGVRFSDETVKCGIFFGKGKILDTKKVAGEFVIYFMADGRKITMTMSEHEIIIMSDDTKDFFATFLYKNGCEDVQSMTDKRICYRHNDMEYQLSLENGRLEGNKFISEQGKIVFRVG